MLTHRHRGDNTCHYLSLFFLFLLVPLIIDDVLEKVNEGEEVALSLDDKVDRPCGGVERHTLPAVEGVFNELRVLLLGPHLCSWGTALLLEGYQLFVSNLDIPEDDVLVLNEC